MTAGHPAPSLRPITMRSHSAPSPAWEAIAWGTPADPKAAGPNANTPVVPILLDADLQPFDTRPLAADSIERADGAVFLVAPATATPCPDVLERIRAALSARPDIGIFYGDDAVVDAEGLVTSVHCKPAFNPGLLMADDYVGFPLIIRASVLAAVTPSFGRREGNAAWFAFCLDALSAGIGLDRIPHTLLASPLARPKAGRKARARVLERWFRAAGQPLTTAAGLTPDTLEIRRTLADPPPVTLVIPTAQSRPKDGDGVPTDRPHIVQLLDSLARSTYPANRITVLIGDDREDDAIYQGRADRFTVKRIDTRRPAGEPFNYAAKMNRLWRAAETDLIILMNDDLVVRRRGWIEALLTFAMDQGVGGVGGRLLFPDGTIQHAGMTGGIFGVFAHPWYKRPAAERTYADWALTQRDCSAVTGALFATRKAVLEAVNGFDEGFALDFNDVDLCLKLRLLGYRIVYTPFAEMAHHESASRTTNFAPGSQTARFLRRWHDVLAEDPSYSPQLRTDTDVVAPRADATRWITERGTGAAAGR
jgi:O-antigen biosynthesis protein